MEVEVSEVVHGLGVNPVDVKLENGQICDGLESKLKCELFKNKANQGVLAAYTTNMIYTGEIGSEEDMQLNYNFLVIRNKKGNKVRLVNMDQVCIKPYVKPSSELEDSTVIAATISSAQLNKQFGSKKQKATTEQRERLKLDIENVKEQLEQTVAAIKTDEYFLNATQQPTEDDSSYKPPINRDASTVDKVYKLENLIPPPILDALESEVDLILESENFDKLGLFDFCKQNIETLIEYTSSSEASKKRCKIYVYINYLLKFLATPARAMSKKFVLCSTSREVDSHILDNFSLMTGSNRTRPISMRDKCICYILVLGMLASNNHLDLEILSKDMKIGLKKLQMISRVLAFSYSGPKTVVLKLPLPAPVVSNQKKKKY